MAECGVGKAIRRVSPKTTVWERLERIKRGEATIKPSKIPPRNVPSFLPEPNKKFGEFGNVDEGDYKSWIARRVALRVAPSVVCLSSFVGGKKLFACSGIVIEWADNVGTILTSATLLTGHLDDVPSDVMVKVCLPNREKVNGTISHYDLHHNLATIKMPSVSQLTISSLLLGTGQYYPGRNVVALGRHYVTNEFMASHGEILHIDNGFDSDNLVYSSCGVTEYGVGGPLVDISSGLIVGLNLAGSGKNYTAFLPSSFVLRCLKHFKAYGRVLRPWLGMRIRDLFTLKIAELEKIFQKFPNIRGIYVDKVIEGSPAACAGVCAGDIVTDFDGTCVPSCLEFVGLLFDKAENIMELTSATASDSAVKRRAIAVEIVIERGSSSGRENKSIIVDDRLCPSVTNRWPLHRPRPVTKNTCEHGLTM